MKEKELTKLQTPIMEKYEEIRGNQDANSGGSLEVVEEEHQDSNLPAASPIPDPGEVNESDNDVLVIDLSDDEEVEGPEKECKKSGGSPTLHKTGPPAVANETKNVRAEKGQAGMWQFSKRCFQTNRSRGYQCQIMCPNLDQRTGRPCSARLTFKNLDLIVRLKKL